MLRGQEPGRACDAPDPPPVKGGIHKWAPQEEGFWARVCKAIFLCSEREGKGIEGKVWGMNTGYGERVRSEGKGPVSGVTGMHRPREPPPSPSTWGLNLAAPGPAQDPEDGGGRGHNCRTIRSAPSPTPHLQPLLPF